MHLGSALLTDIYLPRIIIITEVTHSGPSSIFETVLYGQKYALKLFHDNGDPGYTDKGHELN